MSDLRTITVDFKGYTFTNHDVQEFFSRKGPKGFKNTLTVWVSKFQEVSPDSDFEFDFDVYTRNRKVKKPNYFHGKLEKFVRPDIFFKFYAMMIPVEVQENNDIWLDPEFEDFLIDLRNFES